MGIIDSLLHLAVAGSAAAVIPVIQAWEAGGTLMAARALVVAGLTLAGGLLTGHRGVLWVAAAVYFGALVLHGLPAWIWGVALGMVVVEVWGLEFLARAPASPSMMVTITTAVIYYPFSLQVNLVCALYYMGVATATYFERRSPGHLFVSLGKILGIAAAAKLTLVAPEVAFLAVMGSIVAAPVT